MSVFCVSVSADTPHVRITEFLYNGEGTDAGKEYVEVFNAGPGPIDMTAVVFSEHDRQHTLRSGIGDSVLEPGAVAIIVERPEAFLSQYDFTGTVLDSAGFSLNNTGSILALLYRGTVLHTVSYMKRDGADGNGKSLHVGSDDMLSARSPSPGFVSGISVVRGTDEPDVSVPDIFDTVSEGVLFVTEPAVIFSASDTLFSVRDTGTGDALHGAWNFGDGTQVFGRDVTHAYLYSGTYIISFQEYIDEKPTDRSAVRRRVTVFFPEVAAERVDDSFIRFHNGHPFTLDVSGWKLVSGLSVFVFPPGSFVSPTDSIVVPFATSVGDRILVITAGGGQFNGSRADVLPSQTDISASADSVESAEESDSTAVPSPLPVYSSVTDSVSDSSDVVNGYERLIVWVSLLFGIMAIALVPLFLSRSEEQKNVRRRFRTKRK